MDEPLFLEVEDVLEIHATQLEFLGDGTAAIVRIEQPQPECALPLADHDVAQRERPLIDVQGRVDLEPASAILDDGHELPVTTFVLVKPSNERDAVLAGNESNYGAGPAECSIADETKQVRLAVFRDSQPLTPSVQPAYVASDAGSMQLALLFDAPLERIRTVQLKGTKASTAPARAAAALDPHRTYLGALKRVEKRTEIKLAVLPGVGQPRRELRKAKPGQIFVVLSFAGACADRETCESDARTLEKLRPLLAPEGAEMVRVAGDARLRDQSGGIYLGPKLLVLSGTQREIAYEVPEGADGFVWIDEDRELPLAAFMRGR